MNLRCTHPGKKSGRDCGVCQPCRTFAHYASEVYLDSKVGTPLNELAQRLRHRTGVDLNECHRRILAAVVRAARKPCCTREESDEEVSRDGFTLGAPCERCGLRGEHECLPWSAAMLPHGRSSIDLCVGAVAK